ncbi:MAG: ABC-F family ATP-binding cassette domain-containing protein [Acidobacteriota bacterium]|nr:ABC-F family ATP-binding cassette domain-containing protein [Acidobacteriota bacterium]
MITLAGVAKTYGAQTLFQEVSLQLHRGNRYGLVGANGSGKSTLLRLLTGEEEASAGTIAMPRKARVGFLTQDHFRFENTPILDVVMMGNEALWQAVQEKEALLETAGDDFDIDRYGELEEVILHYDGYNMESRAAQILEGLNIPAAVQRRPLSTLSGGFKLRVLMARTLASDPDILLLDEPTNHLDILSIRWLEKFLLDFRGLAVVVSHDHRFLNNVCTHIIDVDYERATLYRGNYTDFTLAKRAERERKEAEIRLREKEIADHKATVERFRAKPTKARQAKSTAKLIEKIVIEDLPRSSRRYPNFVFRACRPSGKTVLEVRGVSKSYGENRVLENVSLTVRRGDALAIIGPNGIGKSTLLKIIMGEVSADAGEVEWGYETHRGYFPQENTLAGSPGESIENWLWRHCPGQPIGFVRANLARVLFSREEVDKRIGSLSGGEGARLILARLGVEKPNVLVLDEPTNHLDLEGIESLARGLEAYDGTVIFVSHDRWFVSRLATRVIEITSEGMTDFPGTYDDYLAACGDDHLDVDAVLRRARRKKARQDP